MADKNERDTNSIQNFTIRRGLRHIWLVNASFRFQIRKKSVYKK